MSILLIKVRLKNSHSCKTDMILFTKVYTDKTINTNDFSELFSGFAGIIFSATETLSRIK